ncbi:MAG: hypothetical protein PHI18_02045 [bacterium]|nr:hypothetical protein [bacterium]
MTDAMVRSAQARRAERYIESSFKSLAAWCGEALFVFWDAIRMTRAEGQIFP